MNEDLDDAPDQTSPSRPVYFDGPHPRPDARWAGRGIAVELGPRAYTDLLLEARVKHAGWGWPPGLAAYEHRAG